MKNCAIIFLIVFSNQAFSQEPIIERDVAADRSSVDIENSKNQFRWGYNLTIDAPDSLNTLWSSASLNYSGLRLIRAAKFYSLGVGYGLQFDNYKIEQDSTNLIGGGIHKKQQIHLYSGRIGLINRFYLGKHGIKEGTFIEVGAVGALKIGSRMIIENEIDPKLNGNQGAEEVNVTYKKLQFTELLQYYANAAIGRNGVSLYGEYRLSNLFKSYESINNNRKLPEIAPLNVGIRIEF